MLVLGMASIRFLLGRAKCASGKPIIEIEEAGSKKEIGQMSLR